MAGFTNKGKLLVLQHALQGTAPAGSGYAIFLATSAVAPTADTNTKSELTEIATGNGYTAGGINVNRDATDWDTATEVDASDWSLAQLKDIVWTASGGNLPASGNGARYALLTDRNATLADRCIYFYWDLVSDRTVSDTQTLTLQNAEVRLTES